MSDELQVYEPPSDDNRPNWGVIILTGIAALLLVVGIGVLSQQASRFLESVDLDPTATLPRPPSQEPAPGSPALVYAVPHRGEWQITARVTYPNATIIEFSSRGTGRRIEPPQYDLPVGGSVVTEALYQIIVEYPILNSNPPDSASEIRMHASPESFRAALRTTYYALYDANQRFIEVIDQQAYDETYWALPLQSWGIPPPAPALTPESTP